MKQLHNNKRSLREQVLSNTNIYNAIYCMESYVFEKGLLNEEDIKRYYKLRDKFDFETIHEVIGECQERLTKLLDDKYELFTAKVYFKIKKWEDRQKEDEKGTIKFRPIHTAGLVDQICMVAMLQPLMFDDVSGKRKRSELSKMIPHEFFGNLPSDNVENLFKPWIQQYRRYNDTVIEHCRDYQKNHRYRTEITLDIKNFFPSISPEFIFKFVGDILRPAYKTAEDKITLDTLLTKLLFCKLKPDNIEGWEKAYYGKSDPPDTSSLAMTKGIAQGLPQSYFFGNLCMIEIRNKIMALEDFRNCDAMFYVDDSVIYIEKPYNKPLFEKTIKSLNDAIKELGKPEHPFDSMSEVMTDEQIAFQSNLDYEIQFHSDGKSEYCHIEDADTGIGGLDSIRRNTSMAGAIFGNTEETEDRFSKDKIEKILELVDDEIIRINTELQKKIEKGEKTKDATLSPTRLKLLKRFKRFYLYRLKALERRIEDSVSDDDIEDFKLHYNLPCFLTTGCQLSYCRDSNLRDWFETFDEDIFQAESRMFISQLPFHKAEKLKAELVEFEKALTDGFSGNASYLFFGADFETSLRMKQLKASQYESLARLVSLHFTPGRSLSIIKQKTNFEEFVKNMGNCRAALSKGESNEDSRVLDVILPSYTHFIFANSEEFCRVILNAYYSIHNEIEPNEARAFTKYSSRGLNYTELRILARLRNRVFNLRDFIRALADLDAKDLDNRMSIDMELLEVLNIFITKLHDPEWVDRVILTHRVVKGLWYNGSKFMNSYTLHNEEHAVTLIKAVVKLVKAIDYFSIKRKDYYILFLVCYLHDISMVIHPNMRAFCNGDDKAVEIVSRFVTDVSKKFNDQSSSEAEEVTHPSSDARFKELGHLLLKEFEAVYDYFSDSVRSRHPHDSASKIRMWEKTVLKHLSTLVVDQVAKTSESHGYNSDEVYGLKSQAGESLISEKYAAILIRLADLMDVANDRINYNLLRQNVVHMPLASQFHWISHLITDEIRIAPTFEADSKSDSPIQKRKITERLNFNLFLNVKYLANVNNKCSESLCRRSNRDFDREVVTLTEEYSDCDGMTLEMWGVGHACPENYCPILCRWMMSKHEWLINELVALNKYLKSVNDRMFDTEIRLNLIYRDDFPLEPDLFDNIRSYLNTCKY